MAQHTEALEISLSDKIWNSKTTAIIAKRIIGKKGAKVQSSFKEIPILKIFGGKPQVQSQSMNTAN